MKTEAAAVTVSHPVRRLLAYLNEERVGVEEALSWMDGKGTRYILRDVFFARSGGVNTRTCGVFARGKQVRRVSRLSRYPGATRRNMHAICS